MIDYGRAIPIARGLWQTGTTYEWMDMVYDENGAYLCIEDCNNSEPVTDKTHWATIVDLTLIK